MLKLALVLVLLIVGANAAVWDRKQQAGVRGVLLCHGEPARDVLVKMYDADFGFDTDDLMGVTHTRADGSFEVSGQEAELLTLDVKVNFYHNCDDRIVPCERKFSIGLPSKYVTSGDDPIRFYNVGVLELSGKYDDEERDCIH
ncbi:Transthyretin-like protein 5 [Aphelenchoides fujianensis]|nr:Transthyretin-like protein 5 [Aphelenchoides fujianensis]